ncbi:uncharacterized protein LOC142334003 [Lycorma delicatula]|uniref:uncharacterized protein LOC142334003 n=1 Tax=Lycorma delicatula TaxID=130591 RepID=UPI003F51773E
MAVPFSRSQKFIYSRRGIYVDGSEKKESFLKKIFNFWPFQGSNNYNRVRGNPYRDAFYNYDYYADSPAITVIQSQRSRPISVGFFGGWYPFGIYFPLQIISLRDMFATLLLLLTLVFL